MAPSNSPVAQHTAARYIGKVVKRTRDEFQAKIHRKRRRQGASPKQDPQEPASTRKPFADVKSSIPSSDPPLYMTNPPSELGSDNPSPHQLTEPERADIYPDLPATSVQHNDSPSTVNIADVPSPARDANAPTTRERRILRPRDVTGYDDIDDLLSIAGFPNSDEDASRLMQLANDIRDGPESEFFRIRRDLSHIRQAIEEHHRAIEMLEAQQGVLLSDEAGIKVELTRALAAWTTATGFVERSGRRVKFSWDRPLLPGEEASSDVDSDASSSQWSSDMDDGED